MSLLLRLIFADERIDDLATAQSDRLIFFFCKRNIRFFFDAEHHQRPTISNRRVMMKQNRIASKAALKETRYARIEIQ